MNRMVLGLIALVFSTLLIGCSPSKTVSLQKPEIPAPGGGGEQNKPQPPPTPEEGEEPGPGNPDQPTPSPTPAPTSKVARIICENGTTANSSFFTLRSDVRPTYTMPSIYFSTSDGTEIRGVNNPTLLKSNGKEMLMLLDAQENYAAPRKIYKANVDLLSRRGILQQLYTYPVPTNTYTYTYDAMDLFVKILGTNEYHTAFIYPDDSGEYIYDVVNGQRKSLPFNAKKFVNPSTTGGDAFVRFDQIELNRGYNITQTLYSFKTGNIISMAPPLDSRDYQLFAYVTQDKYVLWAEGRPGGIWKIRSKNLFNSKEVTTLAVLESENNMVKMPVTFFQRGSNIYAAYVEEEYAKDNKGYYLKTGNVHVLKLSNTKNLGSKIIPYPPEFERVSSSQLVSGTRLIKGLFYEPISGKLYGSLKMAGGLVSIDVDTKQFEYHAKVTPLFGCVNPSWTTEVINE